MSKEGEQSKTSTGKLLGYLSLVLGCGGGLALPAGAAFLQNSPPLVTGVGTVIGFVALAVALVTFQRSRRKEEHGRPVPSLLVAVAAYVIYQLLLQSWTIEGHSADQPRQSIGFGMARWSLTDAGSKTLQAENPPRPIQTPRDLWLFTENATRHGPSIVWKDWSIQATTILLCCVYLLTFILWGRGWGLMAARSFEPDDVAARRRIEANQQQGRPSTIVYRSAPSAEPRTDVVSNASLLSGIDGMVLRARLESGEGVVRHYSLRRVVRVDTVGGQMLSHEQTEISDQRVIAMPRNAALGDSGFLRLVEAVRDATVSTDAAMAFRDATEGEPRGRVDAACACVLAEHLLGYAADGLMERAEQEEIRRILQRLALMGWSPL